MALLLSILLFCVNIITAATFNDFKLCVQLSDKSAGSNKGEKECTDWLSNGDSKSDWAGDKDWHNPEYIRVRLKARKVSKSMKNIDFRFCIQVKGEEKSDWECTDWATKGEDWSDWAYDDNKNDFDSVRVKIETKKESGIYIKSVSAGVRAANKDKDKDDWSKGNKEYTSNMLGSSSKDESWTDWAYGSDKSDLDMDALRIFVDAEFQKETTTGGAGICGEAVRTETLTCNIKDSYIRDTASPKCPSGYESYSDFMCIEEDCPSGYKDVGVACSKTKWCETQYGKSYPCGTETKKKDIEDATCPSGYTDIQLRCLKDCKNDYTDFEIKASPGCICNVEDYATNVADYVDMLQALSCFKTLQNALAPIYKLDPDKLDDLFTSKKKDAILNFFKPFLGDIKTFFADAIEIATDMVGVIEISASAHAGGGGTSAAGIVLEFSTGELYFYYAACAGFKTDVEVGVGISLIFFDSIDSVSGQSRVFNIGADLDIAVGGGVGVGVDVFIITDISFIPIGFGASIGLGMGIMPVEFGVHECLASELIGITSWSSSLKKDAVLLNSFKDVGSSNRDGKEYYDKWVIMVLVCVVCLMLINVAVCFKMRNKGGNKSDEFVKVNVTDSEDE